MRVKYEFEIAPFGFARQGHPTRVKRTEETTLNEKFSADTGSDEWNPGMYEELFQIPSDVMVKTSVELKRSPAGPNQLFSQNRPA